MDRLRAAISGLAAAISDLSAEIADRIGRATPARWDPRAVVQRLREVNILVVVVALLVSSTVVVTAVQTRAEASLCPAGLSTTGRLGSPEDPCLIANAADLALVRTALGANYRQTANIALPSGEWTPIGTVATPFTGSYDGGSYTVSNMQLGWIGGVVGYGLFGAVHSATIQNLRVTIQYLIITRNAGQDAVIGGAVGLATGTSRIERVSVGLASVDTTVLFSPGNNAGGAFTGLLRFGGVVGAATGGAVVVDSVSYRGKFSFNSDPVDPLFEHSVGGVVGYSDSTIRRSAADINFFISTLSTEGPTPEVQIGRIVGRTGGGSVEESFGAGFPVSDPQAIVRYGIIGRVGVGTTFTEVYGRNDLSAGGIVDAGGSTTGIAVLANNLMTGTAAATNMTSTGGRWAFPGTWTTVTTPFDGYPVLTWTTIPAGTVAPGAPRTPAATLAGATATVTWSAPEQVGTPNNSSIALTYTVTSNPAITGGGTCTTATLSCEIENLRPGVAYTFTVTATNAIGTGPASVASDAVTPARAESISIGAPVAQAGSTVTVPVTLTDFPIDRSYQVFASIPEGRGTLTLGTTTDLDEIYGYDATTFQRSDGRELGFSGAYADVVAALASLRFTPVSETANPATELTVTVNEAPSGTNAANIFYFPDNGHYYEYISQASNLTWIQARDAAAQRTLFGRTGYLATITSLEESTFVSTLIDAPNIWIGATDDRDIINASLPAGATAFTGQRDGDRPSEGQWHWVTGPEAGQQFWTLGTPGNFTTQRNGSGGQPFDGAFAAWNNGEPNNREGSSEDEHYASANFACPTPEGGSGPVCDPAANWNDFIINDGGVKAYLVEYGGLGEGLDAASATASRFIVSGAPNDLVPTVIGAGADRQVVLTWAAPVSGASAVSGYQYSVDGGTTWSPPDPSTLSTRTVTLDTETSAPLRACWPASRSARSSVRNRRRSCRPPAAPTARADRRCRSASPP